MVAEDTQKSSITNDQISGTRVHDGANNNNDHHDLTEGEILDEDSSTTSKPPIVS